MARKPAKVAVKAEKPSKAEKKVGKPTTVPERWRPFDSLRREIDRLFEDFDKSGWPSPLGRSVFDLEPLWRRELNWGATPAVDIVDKEKAYAVTAELPGMEEKDLELTVVDDSLTIKGEKQEEKEEKEEGYHLHERRFGSFERRFRIPEGVDTDKIEASFKNGVLTVTLPKKPEAQRKQKKIDVKSA